MSYPRQNSVNDRLHKETLNALESIGSNGLSELNRLWKQHRKEIKLAIMDAYHTAAPSGTWNHASFKSHAQSQLQSNIRGILERFGALTNQTIKASLNALYSHSFIRHAWMLDQVTPQSRNVLIPHRKNLHEAAITSVYYGTQTPKTWIDKWAMWIDSYQSALVHNLELGASNNSSVSDAVSEVDATKSNTPQSSLVDAMIRLYDYAATDAMIQGEKTIADMNGDMVEEEIWKTRGDLAVCDDCDELEGMPIDEAGEYPPLHPNCHCFTKIVPKDYAELLRSGDDSDRELARDMHRAGLVPGAMVVRDSDGNLAAKVVVSFKKWTKDSGFAVSSK